MASNPTTNPLPSGTGDDWFFAGLASSYPNITSRASREPYFKLAWPQPCGRAAPAAKAAGAAAADRSGENQQLAPGCRVFHPRPSAAAATAEEVGIDVAPGEDAWAMREQVVVFRYEGAFHAVDHACPHRAYSLAWGRPFDIEDAARGAVVGRGIRCRGHGYAFELSTGAGDRGGYGLGVWEVEVRPYRGEGEGGGVVGGVVLGGEADEEMEVWVRRRRRRKEG